MLLCKCESDRDRESEITVLHSFEDLTVDETCCKIQVRMNLKRYIFVIPFQDAC